jgi:hypothetical protein
MNDFIEFLNTFPPYVGEGFFNLLTTLSVGLVIAFVTTFYLKKKDERTRVAGVVLEKRVNCGQEILFYLEKLSYHRQMYGDKEQEWYELLKSFELTLPHGRNLQYSDVFSSYERFQNFFKGFEEIITTNKLWMDKKVRFHLSLMQAYLSWINALLIGITRVPLPECLYLKAKVLPGRNWMNYHKYCYSRSALLWITKSTDSWRIWKH